nr:hypothetical protein [Tanacetum cinerariifolium]
DEEEQESRLSEEARIQEEEDSEELYRDVNINQGRGLQVTQNVEDTYVILTPERLRLLETSFAEYRQTNQFADAMSAIPGIVHQYMDQQMKEVVREEGSSAGPNRGSKRQKERGEQASASTPSE